MKKNVLYIILALVVLALIGLGIYFIIGSNNKDALAFKNEYEVLNGKENAAGKVHRTIKISRNNPYVKTTPAEIVKMLENKETFYLYVGDPLCPWCRSVLETSIKVAKENKIDKIYYIEIWDDDQKEILRDKYELKDGKVVKAQDGTKEYATLLKAFDHVLSDYTLTDKDGKTVQVGEKRIYAPNYFYVKDGDVAKMVEGISDSQKDPREELTKDMLKEQERLFNQLFNN